jgi:cell wall-associated NlpC family hydrolase
MTTPVASATPPPVASTPTTSAATTATATATPPTSTSSASTAPTSAAEPAVRFALAQVGKPYRFAAAGPAAYDCSGLTLAAYARLGVRLPHYAASQARLGRAVNWRRQRIQPGDLVFTAGGRPRHDLGHVGIAVSAVDWVSAPAPGKAVRRSSIPFRLVQAVRRLIGTGAD